MTVVYRQICYRVHIYWSIVYFDVVGETASTTARTEWQMTKRPCGSKPKYVVENTVLSKARQLNSTF
jgi:hypothetical protein